MLAEFIRAFIMAGIPVGVLCYALIWWGLRAEYFERTTELKRFEKQVQELARERKNKKSPAAESELAIKKKYSPVHNKWLMFGGGFYGSVALLTFGLIEAGEIAGFFAHFGDNIALLADFSLGLLIGIFVDQLMNFFSALAWPWYWMQNIDSEYIWAWFVAAYAGYWLGARAALRGWKRGEQQA